MTFARRVFFVAGLYGILILPPQYFLAEKVGRDFPPAITHPEFYYGFIGVALAWQVLFFIIAKDPVRYRLAMLAAVIEKVTFGAATAILYTQGRLAAQMLMAGMIDLAFAVLFVIAFIRTRAADSPGHNQAPR
jgi:hypothetical protein